MRIRDEKTMHSLYANDRRTLSKKFSELRSVRKHEHFLHEPIFERETHAPIKVDRTFPKHLHQHPHGSKDLIADSVKGIFNNVQRFESFPRSKVRLVEFSKIIASSTNTDVF